MNKRKLLAKALAGSKNISFNEVVILVKAFGFRLSRVNGSLIYLSIRGYGKSLTFKSIIGKAKPYQVRQFLELVEQYDLKLGD